RILCSVFFFSSRRRHTRCLSDWSSDVCSSDLAASLLTPDGRRLGAATEGAALALKCRVLLYAASDLYALNPSGRPETGYIAGDQIGRASCRERVKGREGAGAARR